jgi:hypothetical protein
VRVRNPDRRRRRPRCAARPAPAECPKEVQHRIPAARRAGPDHRH